MSDGLRHGDRIPGSRLFRAFCRACGEAMRVPDPDSYPDCEECSGERGRVARSQGIAVDRRLIYLPRQGMG